MRVSVISLIAIKKKTISNQFSMCALGLIRRGSAAVAHVAEVAQVAQVAQVAEVAEVALSRRKEHLRPVHGGGVGGGVTRSIWFPSPEIKKNDVFITINDFVMTFQWNNSTSTANPRPFCLDGSFLFSFFFKKLKPSLNQLLFFFN